MNSLVSTTLLCDREDVAIRVYNCVMHRSIQDDARLLVERLGNTIKLSSYDSNLLNTFIDYADGAIDVLEDF